MTLKDQILACMHIAKQGLKQAQKKKIFNEGSAVEDDQIIKIASILLEQKLRGNITEKELIEQSKSTG